MGKVLRRTKSLRKQSPQNAIYFFALNSGRMLLGMHKVLLMKRRFSYQPKVENVITHGARHKMVEYTPFSIKCTEF